MKPRNPFFALVVLVLFALACSGAGQPPTPTETPVPPTSTLEPTNTPTPIPTVNRTATVVAQSTASAEDTVAELDRLLEDTEIPYQNGRLLWKQNERLNIAMRGPDGKILPFAEGIEGRNFILKSDVTWTSTGILVCGAIFRSELDIKEGRKYHFVFLRFSGAPAWAIEFHEFGYFKNSPSGVNYSNSVNLNNKATNQFVLVAQDGEFTVFINRVRQGRFFDYSEQQKEGVFGFFAGQDSGEGNCEYENSWLWELE